MRVSIAAPSGRPLQLRYTCPDTGKRIRISTGTRDMAEAERQRDVLQAKFTLGIDTAEKEKTVFGPKMLWGDFRDLYRKRHVWGLSERGQQAVRSRLDITERIIKPATLEDVANRESLLKLREALASGVGSRYGKQRSPHTVRAYMTDVIAALNWAMREGWLESVPKLPRQRGMSKTKKMKGRPITGEEFDRMIDATGKIAPHPETWRYALRGLLESGLRLEELLSCSWDDENQIRPVWGRGPYPVLDIPAARQKNATEEDIPLLPGFAELLKETPVEDRHGWVFCPLNRRGRRASLDWCGKVITRIGKAAGVIVEPPKRGRPAKCASAHDLRRTCAQRLADAGLPDRILQRIMRHEDITTTRRFYAPGTVQREAEVLFRMLSPKQVYPDSVGTPETVR